MKRMSNARVMCETLENRSLLSASTLQADVNQLVTDATVLKTNIKTLVVDLTANISAGTPGLAHLELQLAQFKVDGRAARLALTADLTTVVADQGTGNEPAAIATLKADVASNRTTLANDDIAIKATLTKHPTLISGDSQLITDETAVNTAWTTVKADFKQLKADLA